MMPYEEILETGWQKDFIKNSNKECAFIHNPEGTDYKLYRFGSMVEIKKYDRLKGKKWKTLFLGKIETQEELLELMHLTQIIPN